MFNDSQNRLHVRMRFWASLLCMAGCFLSCFGCSEESLEFTEVKRPSEKVTQEEYESFIRVIESLPEKRLSEFAPVLIPVPKWSKSRTLRINDLISEAQTEINDRWKVEWVSRQLKRKRSLQRILRQEKMTTEQFVGLILTIGIALNRNTIREDQDLNQIISSGDHVVRNLKTDKRLFHKLKQEGRHAVLRDAVWITRIDRAKRLLEVPPENMELVETHREALVKIFPDYFTNNPLDEFIDNLEEFGIPFENLYNSGFDEITQWDHLIPIMGHDTPDAEFLQKSVPVNTLSPSATFGESPDDMN
jgi:hypothetical protein